MLSDKNGYVAKVLFQRLCLKHFADIMVASQLFTIGFIKFHESETLKQI